MPSDMPKVSDPTVSTATYQEHFATLPSEDGGGPDSPPSPFAAVRRHPFLFALVVLLCTAAGVAVSVAREPVYTSSARLSVGELNPSVQSAPGISEANQQLASSYSRAVTAVAVTRRIERELDLPPGTAGARLSASPIPESPMMVIEGEGASAAEATRVTRAATDSMLAYVQSLGNRDTANNDLLRQLREAIGRQQGAENRVSDSTGPDRDRAEAEADAAGLQVKALQRRYLEATGGGGSTPIEVINPAQGASDDSMQFLRLAVGIGALAGIALGAGLVTALETVRVRRRRNGLA